MNYAISFANGNNVFEGGNIVLNFSRSNGLDQPGSVSYTIQAEGTTGSVNPGADFTSANTGTVNFATGVSNVSITLSTLNDDLMEGMESFAVLLTVPPGSTVDGPSRIVGYILDDDLGGTAYTITPTVSQFHEGDAAMFTVTRGNTLGTASVWWNVSATGANPAAAADFGSTTAGGTLPSGTLSFAAGVASMNITLPIFHDTLTEPDEDFSIYLSLLGLAPGVIPPSTGHADVTILNVSTVSDDYASSFGDTTHPYGTLSNGTAHGIIEQSGDADWFRFNISAPGTYTLDAGSAVIGNSTALYDTTLSIYDSQGNLIEFEDDWIGLDSHIERTLNSGTYYAAVRAYHDRYTGGYYLAVQSAATTLATASIQPITGFMLEGNSGTTPYVFQVSRSNGISTAAVNWAFSGSGNLAANASDFAASQPSSGTISFAAGATVALLTIAVQGDTQVEPDEYFSILLTSGTGADIDLAHSSATGIIYNDDTSITTRSLTPDGQNYTDTIATAYERDTWSLHIATAGSYALDLLGLATGGMTALSDTYLYLYNSAHTLLTSNDDSNNTLYSHIESTLAVGDYLVEAAGYGINVGGYQISARPASQSNANIRIAPVSSWLVEGNSGTTAFVFNVTRSGLTSGITPLTWTLGGLNSTTGVGDFATTQAMTGSFSFASGETQRQITILVLGDTLPEVDESFAVTLSTSAANTTLLSATAYATIGNDDDRPLAFVTAGATAVNEGGSVVFSVNRSGNTSVASTIHWSVAGDGTAAANVTGSDFSSAMAGDLSFAANSATAQNITLRVASDTQQEYGERFRFALSSSNADISTAAGAATVDIVDGSVTNFAIGSLGTVGRTEGSSAASPTAFTYNVVRTGNLSSAASIGWHVESQGAAPSDFALRSGSNYVPGTALPSGSVTFAANAGTATITVLVYGDTAAEPDEAFDVVLSGAAAGQTVSVDRAHGTILNDDVLVANNTRATATNLGILGSTATTVSDFVGSADTQDFYKFTLNNAAGNDFHLRMSGLSADADVVVTDGSGNLATELGIQVGSSTAGATNDEAIDLVNLRSGDYYVRVYQYLGDTSYGLSLSAGAAAQGTLAFAAASVSQNTSEGDSGATNATYTVNRSGNNTGQATVDWAVTSLTPTLDSNDFQSATRLPYGRLTFAAGASSATFTLAIAGDRTVEADEYFSVTLTNASGAVIDLARATANGSIVNDDSAQSTLPSVGIQATDANKLEGSSGATTFVYTVVRSGDLSRPSSVAWAITYPNAANSADAMDFSGPSSGTVSFSANQESQRLTLLVVGDAGIEPDEAFAVALSNASGAVINPRASVAGGLIRNDDLALATFRIDAANLSSANRAEGDGGSTPFVFTISRSGAPGASATPATAAWSVENLTTNASDFAANAPLAGSATFAAGVLSQSITIQVAGDTSIEADERFSVRLDSVTGGSIDTAARSATGIIGNDDQQNLFSITAVTASRQEGNSGSTAFVFNLTSSSGGGSVAWHVGGYGANLNGGDFSGGTLPVGFHSFAANETSALLTIQVAGDLAAEGDEQFFVALGAASGGVVSTRNSATSVIVDDDSHAQNGQAVTVSAQTPTQLEGNTGTTSFVFNLARSGNLNQTASINWAVAAESTSLNGLDFAGGSLPSGTLTFTSGVDLMSVTVLVAGDTAQELDESFSLRIAPGTPGNSTLTIPANGAAALAVIGNDDTLPQVGISATDADKFEGDNGASTPFVFTITRTGTTTTTSVDWSVASSYGTASADDFSGSYSGTQRPGGTVTFAGGQTSQTITVGIRADNTMESDEVFRVDLTNVQGGVFASSNRSASGQIRSDDLPTNTTSRIAIEATDAVNSEGTGAAPTNFVFTVRRSGNLFPSAATTATWAVTSDSAATANDFASGTTTFGAATTLPAGTVTFAAGAETALVTIRVMADNLAEASEGFTVQLTGVTNGELVTTARSAQGLIQSDDSLANVRLERVAADNSSVVSDTTILEGTGSTPTPMRFRISRDAGNATGAINWAVNLSGSQVMATSADFAGATSGTVSFAANETSKFITLYIAPDNTIELTENFALQLAASPGVTYTANHLALSIIDDEDDFGSGVGNARLGALVTSSGTSAGAIGGIMPAGDQDWFRVTLAANTRYEFALGSPEFTTRLGLLDANGRTLGEVQDGANGDSGDGLALFSYTTGTTAATYYLSAQGAAGGMGHYAIAASLAGRDDFAAGTTTTGVIAVDGSMSVGRIETSGDSDWLRINLTGGINYDINIMATTGIGGRLRLLDATGQTLASSDVSNGNLRYRAATTGTAYLAVDGAGGTGLYAVGARTLSNNDPSVVPTLAIVATASSSQAEGNSGTTAFVFDVSRVGNTQYASTATWSLAAPGGDGVATLASDFSGATSGTVSFAADIEQRSITVLVAGDGTVENDERFTVNLTAASNGNLATTSAIGLIRNDDSAPEFNIRTLTQRQYEGTATGSTTPFVFAVDRSVNTGAASTVAWSLGSYDTHFTNSDYVGVASGSLSFANGVTSQTITVNIVRDSIEETDESFYVRLANPVNAVLGDNQAVATIVDDDQAPHLSIQALDAIRNEGDTGTTPFVFTILRSGNSASGDVAVDWTALMPPSHAASAEDFIGGMPRGSITFAANETQRNITLSVAGDFNYEDDESFTVTLSNARNTAHTAVIDQANASGTIRNDDQMTLSLAPASASITEGGSQVFTATRSSTIGSLVAGVSRTDLDAGLGSADFTSAPPTSVSFAAGSTTATFTVRTYDDTVAEGNERFTLALQPGSGYVVTAGAATVLIVDNDRPTLSITGGSSSLNEGTGTTANPNPNAATFTLSRTGPTGSPLTVNWNVGATGDSANAADVAATSGNATFAANASTTTVTLRIVGDSTVENNETFTFNIAPSASNAYVVNSTAASLQVTLLNDDTSSTTRPDYAGMTAATAYAIGALAPARPFSNSSLGESFGYYLPGTTTVDSDDWYRFSLASRGTVTVNLSGLASTADADLQLLNRDGTTVIAGSYNGSGLSDAVTTGMLEAGDYTVRVYRKYASQSSYILTASTTAAVDGAGNSTAQARDIGTLTGTPQSFSDSVSGADPDYYRFTTGTAVTDFRLSLTGLSDNADVTLLGADGHTVEASSAAGGAVSESISVDNLAAGVHYVWVAPMVSGAAVLTPYDLTLSAAPASDTGWNTRELAAANAAVAFSATGSYTLSNGYVGTTDQNDYYRINLAATANLTIGLTGLAADADLLLLNGAGAVVGHSSNANANPENISAGNLAAGDYYVRVWGISGNTPYGLNINRSAVVLPTDGDGSAALASAAVALTATPREIRDTVGFAAQAYNGETSNDGIDRHDWYRFSLSAAARVEVSLADLTGDAEVRVYAASDLAHPVIPSANSTPTANPGGTNSVVFTTNTTLAAGTYYVDVSAATAADSTAYTLGMRTTTGADTGYDRIASGQSDTPLVAGRATINGFVGTSDPDDYYRLSLTVPSNLTATISGLTGNADLRLLRWDDDNGNGVEDEGERSVVAGSYLGGTNSDTFTAGNLAVGTYYVQVYRSTGDSNYALALSKTAAALPEDTDYDAAHATTMGGLGTTALTKSDNIGGLGNHELNVEDTYDWYSFTTPGFQPLLVSLSGLSADADLTLYSSTGTGASLQLTQMRPLNGTPNPTGLNAETFASSTLAVGTYFLRVSSPTEETRSTNYVLRVTRDDRAADTTTTGRITLDSGSGSASGVIDNLGDMDWFRVSLAANTTYVVRESRPTMGAVAQPLLGPLYNSVGGVGPGISFNSLATTGISEYTFTTGAEAADYFLAAGANGSDVGTYRIDITSAVNRPPAVNRTEPDQSTSEGRAFSVLINYDLFTDPEDGNLTRNLQVTLDDGSALPNWLTWDASSRTLYGIAPANSPNLNIRVTGTDSSGLAASDSFMLSTTTDPDDFLADFHTTGTVATGGTRGHIEVAGDEDWFSVELTAGQTYVIDEVSTGVSGGLADAYLRGIFDSDGILIAGSGDDNSGGQLNARVTFTAPSTATYYIAASARSSNIGNYLITMSTGNHAPTVAHPIVDQSAQESQKWTYTLANNTFSDHEGGTLIYSAKQWDGTPLPAWLQFDAANRAFSGTPPANEHELAVVVMAEDPLGLTATDTFVLHTPTATGDTGNASWTIMVYMAADNNLDAHALADLNEMERVALPSNVHVVFELDRASGHDGLLRGEVMHDDNTNAIGNYSTSAEVDSGSPTELGNFINWSASNYSAEHYGLVIWDHGGGLVGVAQDVTSDPTHGGHIISMAGVTSALSTSVVGTWGKFDLVGFATCLQGMVEQAYELRNVANYVVASENESISNNSQGIIGWDFNALLTTLSSDPAPSAAQLATSIVNRADAIHDGFANGYSGAQDEAEPQTLSAVNMSKLPDLVAAINTFVASTSGASGSTWSRLKIDVTAATNYASSGDRDLGEIMRNISADTSLSSTLRTNAQAVFTALDVAVIAQTSDPHVTNPGNGLAIYTGPATTYTASNFSFVADTQWASFVQNVNSAA